ncbi:hypothetical protein [Tetragenococcus solitarius]|uniref:DUF536 domain-containing protein n=1 Tax=Tetragenococcus solitarius TaxID=71453 RepID=A0ABN3Y478_9ENTE|nr:hypothetical protein [Tetragenococcus solitarius]
MTEETGKTLTQLANELNVSRDKIIYRYKKLPEEDYFKENNTIYLLNTGIQKIIDDLGDDIKENKEDTEESQVNPSFDYLVEQLNKKDEQIDQLHKLVDQQQQLNAEDKKLIKEMHQYLSLEAPKEENSSEEDLDKKLQQKDEQLAQLKEQLQQTEALHQEKEALETELASLKQKNKKWYQFWK